MGVRCRPVGAHASTGHLALAFGGCVALGILILFAYTLLFSNEPMVKGYARVRCGIAGMLAVVFAGAGLHLLLIIKETTAHADLHRSLRIPAYPCE